MWFVDNNSELSLKLDHTFFIISGPVSLPTITITNFCFTFQYTIMILLLEYVEMNHYRRLINPTFKRQS